MVCDTKAFFWSTLPCLHPSWHFILFFMKGALNSFYSYISLDLSGAQSWSLCQLLSIWTTLSNLSLHTWTKCAHTMIIVVKKLVHANLHKAPTGGLCDHFWSAKVYSGPTFGQDSNAPNIMSTPSHSRQMSFMKYETTLSHWSMWSLDYN